MYEQITIIQPNNRYMLDRSQEQISLGGVGEGSLEELVFELDLQELSEYKRKKVSLSQQRAQQESQDTRGICGNE